MQRAEKSLAFLHLFTLAALSALRFGQGVEWTPAVRLALAFAGLILAPGHFLTLFFLPGEKNLARRLPLSFALGMCAMFFPVMSCWAAPCGLTALSNRCLATAWIVSLAALMAGLRKPAAPGTPSKGWGSSLASPAAACLALALLSGWLTWRIGGELAEDTPVHLLMMRKFIERPVVSLAHLYYKDLPDDTLYNHLLWQPLLAALGDLSGRDIREVWLRVPALLAPISVCAAFLLTGTFLKGRDGERAGAIAATAVFLGLGGLLCRDFGFDELNAAYGMARWCLVPAAWTLFLGAMRGGGKKTFLLTAFFPTVLASVHLIYWLLYVFGAAAATVALLAFEPPPRDWGRRGLRLAAATLAFSSPYLAVRFQTYDIVHPMLMDRAQIEKLDYLTGFLRALPGDWAVISPEFSLGKIYVTIHSASALAAAGFLAAATLHAGGLPIRERLTLTAPFAAAACLMLNPIAVRLIVGKISWEYMAILNQGLPFAEATGVWAFLMARNWRPGFSAVRLLGPAALAAVGLAALRPGIGNVLARLKDPVTIEKNLPHPAIFDDLNALKKPSVLLTDPDVAAHALAASAHYAAALPPYFVSPTDAQALARVDDARSALDPSGDLTRTIGVLMRREVDYILIPPTHDPRKLRGKYGARPDAIRLVLEKDGWDLYAVDREALAGRETP